MKKRNQGFTLVEIMIVVAIIAILAAVAIPNFVKYRRNSQAAACVSNLKQIQAAMEQAKLSGKAVNAQTLYGNTGYIKVEPHCPAQPTAQYTVPTDDTSNPTCSIARTLDANDSAAWHDLDKSASGT